MRTPVFLTGKTRKRRSRSYTRSRPSRSFRHADFLCFDSVIVELKAIKALTNIESAQVLHYLKATGFERELLINFGTSRLDYKRFVESKNHPRPSVSSAANPKAEDSNRR